MFETTPVEAPPSFVHELVSEVEILPAANEVEKVVSIRPQYTQEQIELIKRTICPAGISDDEFQLFMGVVQRTGLNPFTRQVYAIKRWNSQAGREIMRPEISIDGARLIAERTGRYLGQTAAQWCGPDGVWRDVWLEEGYPSAARVGVLKKGNPEPTYGIAKFREYVVLHDEKKYNPQSGRKEKTGKKEVGAMWKKMPSTMVAKCAEMLALRKAFPDQLSGLYTPEEMEQADNNKPEPRLVENESTQKRSNTTQKIGRNSPPPLPMKDHHNAPGRNPNWYVETIASKNNFSNYICTFGPFKGFKVVNVQVKLLRQYYDTVLNRTKMRMTNGQSVSDEVQDFLQESYAHLSRYSAPEPPFPKKPVTLDDIPF